MDEKLLAVLLGIIAGGIGYWITTFWMKPILQYRELRLKVFADFIFYAQVVNADGLMVASQEGSSSRDGCKPPYWLLQH
ncbi:MAG: hypothetical protein LUP91_02115 [Methylococcaceae bacterium]|nr:hypothetical protein [Methylococcaceae bacterium]